MVGKQVKNFFLSLCCSADVSRRNMDPATTSKEQFFFHLYLCFLHQIAAITDYLSDQ